MHVTFFARAVPQPERRDPASSHVAPRQQLLTTEPKHWEFLVQANSTLPNTNASPEKKRWRDHKMMTVMMHVTFATCPTKKELLCRAFLACLNHVIGNLRAVLQLQWTFCRDPKSARLISAHPCTSEVGASSSCWPRLSHFGDGVSLSHPTVARVVLARFLEMTAIEEWTTIEALASAQ